MHIRHAIQHTSFSNKLKTPQTESQQLQTYLM